MSNGIEMVCEMASDDSGWKGIQTTKAVTSEVTAFVPEYHVKWD
jgi:hypothetical protein